MKLWLSWLWITHLEESMTTIHSHPDQWAIVFLSSLHNQYKMKKPGFDILYRFSKCKKFIKNLTITDPGAVAYYQNIIKFITWLTSPPEQDNPSGNLVVMPHYTFEIADQKNAPCLYVYCHLGPFHHCIRRVKGDQKKDQSRRV